MNEFEQIGKILKTKGFDGTTVISLDYPLIDDSFKALFIQKGAMYSPLLIDKMEEIDEFTLHIKWTQYTTKEHAQSLNNTDLYIPSNLIEKYFDKEAVEDFIGYMAYNHEEPLGEVIQLFENKFQETIEVELPTGKKILIPLIDEFVVTIDDDLKKIYCNLSKEYIETFSV